MNIFERIRPAAAILFFLFAFFPLPATGESPPEKGNDLPALSLPSPQGEKERRYLGVEGDTFSLSQVKADLILFEVIGIYCPQCYRQAPLFNTLFSRIEKGKLRGRVKMLALAAGGTAAEIVFLNQQGPYAFPVLPDPDFTAHKLLGEPRTPFTMLVEPTGRVHYAHLGVVADIDALYGLIRNLVEKAP